MPDTNELERLLAAVARRDGAAFGQLYERTASKLLGVVLRITRERAKAEDILQDVYLRVWEKAGSFDPAAGRPMSWLITIARYRAIDVARQRSEVASQGGDDADLDRIDTAVDPRDGAFEIEIADQLRHCLGRLEDLQRRCILEAYYEGYSRDELARRHAQPVNTIKTWLHRGSRVLRSCLEEA